MWKTSGAFLGIRKRKITFLCKAIGYPVPGEALCWEGNFGDKRNGSRLSCKFRFRRQCGFSTKFVRFPNWCTAVVSRTRLTFDADSEAGNEAELALSGQFGRIAVGVIAVSLVVGCGKTAPPPPATDTGIDRIIADAVRKTAAANKAAADLEKRRAGILAVPSQVSSSPSSAGPEERLFTLRWNGPLESLMRSLAIASDNEFVAHGTAPARPVFVSVVADEVALPEAVRMADQAAFGLASAQFQPRNRRITVRYPPL